MAISNNDTIVLWMHQSHYVQHTDNKHYPPPSPPRIIVQCHKIQLICLCTPSPKYTIALSPSDSNMRRPLSVTHINRVFRWVVADAALTPRVCSTHFSATNVIVCVYSCIIMCFFAVPTSGGFSSRDRRCGCGCTRIVSKTLHLSTHTHTQTRLHAHLVENRSAAGIRERGASAAERVPQSRWRRVFSIWDVSLCCNVVSFGQHNSRSASFSTFTRSTVLV